MKRKSEAAEGIENVTVFGRYDFTYWDKHGFPVYERVTNKKVLYLFKSKGEIDYHPQNQWLVSSLLMHINAMI